MVDKNSKKQRIRVRVENPSYASGHVGHMTADEIKERAAHDDINLSCPACGLIHLDREEIEALEEKKIVDSQRYKQLQQEVEISLGK